MRSSDDFLEEGAHHSLFKRSQEHPFQSPVVTCTIPIFADIEVSWDWNTFSKVWLLCQMLTWGVFLDYLCFFLQLIINLKRQKLSTTLEPSLSVLKVVAQPVVISLVFFIFIFIPIFFLCFLTFITRSCRCLALIVHSFITIITINIKYQGL